MLLRGCDRAELVGGGEEGSKGEKDCEEGRERDGYEQDVQQDELLPDGVGGRGEVGPVVAHPLSQLLWAAVGVYAKPAEVAPDERVLARQTTMTAPHT